MLHYLLKQLIFTYLWTHTHIHTPSNAHNTFLWHLYVTANFFCLFAFDSLWLSCVQTPFTNRRCSYVYMYVCIIWCACLPPSALMEAHCIYSICLTVLFSPIFFLINAMSKGMVYIRKGSNTWRIQSLCLLCIIHFGDHLRSNAETACCPLSMTSIKAKIFVWMHAKLET